MEISTFCGNIYVLWILSAFWGCICIFGYYLHLVDIICILWIYARSVDIICISWIYPHFVDITCIDHITIFLASNVCHGINSFVRVVDIIYIGHITSVLARNFYPIFHNHYLVTVTGKFVLLFDCQYAEVLVVEDAPIPSM